MMEMEHKLGKEFGSQENMLLENIIYIFKRDMGKFNEFDKKSIFLISILF